MTVLEINGDRLWETLEASGQIGRIGERGLRRLALTDEDKRMRDLFVGWIKEAGCSVEVDRVGNVFARRAGTDAALPPVAMGSHLDTQVKGGRYDGILGVLAGLEIFRTLDDNGLATKRPLELIVWTNEEGGRFFPSMMGASAFAGVVAVDEVLASRDAAGKSVAEELERIGFAGDRPVGGRPYDSYFELHIEQGPVLHRAGPDIGIVTGAYKVNCLKVRFTGETAHVGPTPMEERHNALVGAGYLIAAVNDIGWKYQPEEAKTTITHIDCSPNLYGIIPDEVTLTIDYRHLDEARAEAMGADVRAAIDEAAGKAMVAVEVVDSWKSGHAPFDAACIDLLRETVKDLGLPFREMPSQAGHDAYSVARVVPTAMIFTPCVDGVTHNVGEDIELARTVPGVTLLANAVVRRADG